MPARSVPLLTASREPARRPPAPGGPAPALGNPGPRTPGPDSRESPDPAAGPAGQAAVRRKGQVAGRRAAPRAPGGRRSHRAVRHAAVRPDAAARETTVLGRTAGGESLPGAASAVRRRASRRQDAARAGRPIPGHTLPDGLTGANKTLAAYRGPSADAADQAAGQLGGAWHARGRSNNPGSQGRRGRRLLPDTGRPGTRRCRRRLRHWPGRVCLCQASRPDDSPATSWTRRGRSPPHPSSVGRTRLSDRADE